MIVLKDGSEILLHLRLLIMVKLDTCCVYALSVDDTWKADSVFWALSGCHLFSPEFNMPLLDPFRHDIEVLRDLVYSAMMDVCSNNKFIAPLMRCGQLRPVGHEYLHSQDRCPCRTWCDKQSTGMCKCRKQLGEAMETLWGRASGLAPAVLFEVHPTSKHSRLARLNHANMVKIWESTSYYTFHGTNSHALMSILDQGLDPNKNKRGNYGMGATYMTPLVSYAANSRFSAADADGCKTILVTHFVPGENAREVKSVVSFNSQTSSRVHDLQHEEHNRKIMADSSSHSGFNGSAIRTSWKDPLLGQVEVEYLLCELSPERVLRQQTYKKKAEWIWRTRLFNAMKKKVEEYNQVALKHENDRVRLLQAEATQKACAEDEVMHERRRHDEDVQIMLSLESSDRHDLMKRERSRHDEEVLIMLSLERSDRLNMMKRERQMHEEDVNVLGEIARSDELDLAIRTEKIISIEYRNNEDRSVGEHAAASAAASDHSNVASDHGSGRKHTRPSRKRAR